MTTIFRCDAQNVVLSFFKLIIGLMYLKRKATLWLYSNFIVILYTNVSIMYRRPCLWSYDNNVSSGVARGGWVFNNENFVWQVCNFEWNDQFQGYISAELPRASYYDGLKKMEYSLKSREDGVILTFMLSYFLYRIIFPQKNIPPPSVENTWRPKITKKILRWVWLALLDFRKNIQK